MILTGHQPTYLPWLGLFNKISNSDYFVLFDTVQYLPKEWMNRNKLKSPNGSFFISVPVLDKSFLNKKIYSLDKFINRYNKSKSNLFNKVTIRNFIKEFFQIYSG